MAGGVSLLVQLRVRLMLTRRLTAPTCVIRLRKPLFTSSRLRLQIDNDHRALVSRVAVTGVRLYAQFPPGGGFPRGFQGMNVDGAGPAKGEALKEFVS